MMNAKKTVGYCLAVGAGLVLVLSLAWVSLDLDETEGAPAFQTPPSREQPNGFDISNATIPRDQIRSGGVPRDGIPAIDNPKFIPVGKVDFLHADDLVISVSAGGRTRAYPLRILVWHEIANDSLGDRDFTVTYCPLCGTAMVFDRAINGKSLTFGVSGLLYHSDVLMYDRQTKSLWSQIAMSAVSGPMAGTRLEWLPSEHMTWAAWKAKHPEGEVLSTDTGHARNYAVLPYSGYEEQPGTMFPVPKHRDELPEKAWVIGIIVNGRAKAYPMDRLPSGKPVQDEVGGMNVEVFYDAGTRSATIRDTQRQAVLPNVQAYWFAWQAFYPETELWRP